MILCIFFSIRSQRHSANRLLDGIVNHKWLWLLFSSLFLLLSLFPFLHGGRKLWKSMFALISIRGGNLSSSENWNTWNEFSSTYFYFFSASNLYFRVGSHETLFTQVFEKLIIPFVTNIRSTVYVSTSKCKLLLHMHIKNYITQFTDWFRAKKLFKMIYFLRLLNNVIKCW